MKIVTLLKKNKLLFIVSAIYLLVFIFSPDKASESISNSMYYLFEMLQVLPVIFLLTVAVESLIPKEMIIRGFGEKSGIRGNLLALVLGSISAGPIYAAFPIGKTLLGKGAGISNVVIILSSWAVIKVPMLANEAKFLGINFMIVRWVLTVTAIFIMAYATAKIVKRKDLPVDSIEQDLLVIKEDYCIGCGLCAKMLPEVYEMKNEKAVVIKGPEGKTQIRTVVETTQKCPSKAIIWLSPK